MCTSSSGGTPSYVLEYFVNSVFENIEADLVDIINDKDEGEKVVVADDLVGVKAVKNVQTDKYVLFAKDRGKYANPDVIQDGMYDYMRYGGGFTRNYDQSNWVMLESESSNPDALRYLEGHVIKGGTIVGAFTNRDNPTIRLAAATEPKIGASETYDPNVYVVPSFCDAYAQEGSEYFFVRPKPQEYCTVQWANYDGATDAFFVPASEDGNNQFDLSGGFQWNGTYTTDLPMDKQAYTFPAVVNVIADPATTCNVWVHVLDNSSNWVEGGTYIYAYKDGVAVTDAWPGTPLTAKRQSSGGTASDWWYYFSFGTTVPDAVIFNRGDNTTQTNNLSVSLGDNFYNYFCYYDNQDYRGERLSGYERAPRRAADSSNPKVGAMSERYMVLPLELGAEQIVTAVADVRQPSPVVAVSYIDIMGRVSSNPVPGINIVVTRYADGSQSATKVVY